MLDQSDTPAISGETQRDTDVEAWKREFREQLFSVLGHFLETATTNDKYLALAYSVRAHLLGRWARTSQTYLEKRSRTVCYLSAEFLLGPHLGNNLVNLGAFGAVKKAMTELGVDFHSLLEQEQEPGLGNGGLGTPRRLLPRFAGDLADSGDRLRHPLRVRHVRPADPRRLAGRGARPLAASRQSVGDPPSRDRLQCRLRRPDGSLYGRERPLPRPLDSRPHRPRHRLRHADPRLPGQHHQHAAAVERRGDQFVRPRIVQHRRLLRRRHGKGGVGDHQQGALSRRHHAQGQAAAARAAVFPGLLRAAGHGAHPSADRDRPQPLPQEIRRPAQRHPSGAGGDRADAHPGRRKGHGMGAGLGGHPPDHGLHQSHAAAGGAGEMAGRHVRQRPAAPSRDRLRDQPPLPRRGLVPLSGRRRSPAPAGADRRERRALGAHGASRLRRQPRRQRRRRTAQQSPQDRRAARTSPSCGRPSSSTSPTA